MYLVTKRSLRQAGAVSIFIVIFTALLVTVVTTSFVQIMMHNQQQSSNNDLSQSAYDSAMAGVEDAKRALVRLKSCQRNPVAGCSQLQTVMATQGDQCQVLGNPSVNVSNFVNGEVTVGDPSLNQAYTCVKVKVQTDSYVGTLLDQHDTVVIPLLPVGDSNAMQTVRISWYTADDLQAGATVPVMPTSTDLPPLQSWGANTPPILRAQLMQFNQKQPLTLENFTGDSAHTKLIFPLTSAQRPLAVGSFADDNRRANAPYFSSNVGGCSTNFGYGGYACSVEINLPAMAAPAVREAYLQLAGIYTQKTMHYRVELLSNAGAGSVLNFDNVQPEVDSTGRASDLFRRVRANVTVSPSGSPLPFPEAPVTTRNLCKEFFVTDDGADYNGDGNSDGDICEPSRTY